MSHYQMGFLELNDCFTPRAWGYTNCNPGHPSNTALPRWQAALRLPGWRLINHSASMITIQVLRYLKNKITHILHLCGPETEWPLFTARYCLQYSSIMPVNASLIHFTGRWSDTGKIQLSMPIFNIRIWTSRINFITLLWLLFQHMLLTKTPSTDRSQI